MIELGSLLEGYESARSLIALIIPIMFIIPTVGVVLSWVTDKYVYGFVSLGILVVGLLVFTVSLPNTNPDREEISKVVNTWLLEESGADEVLVVKIDPLIAASNEEGEQEFSSNSIVNAIRTLTHGDAEEVPLDVLFYYGNERRITELIFSMSSPGVLDIGLLDPESGEVVDLTQEAIAK